jgi:hypothetical protein
MLVSLFYVYISISPNYIKKHKGGAMVAGDFSVGNFLFCFMLADLPTGIQAEPEDKKYRGTLLI